MTRAKYDSDRRKAGLLPAFKQPTQYPTGRGNPYTSAQSAYPPPPRRTATTAGTGTSSWRNTTTGASGADRFANFAKAAPTSKRDGVPDRANVFNAWQNMNPGKPQPGKPQPGNSTPNRGRSSPQKSGQSRPAPPPRADTRFPTEDDIRAGMNYRAAPAGGFGSDRSRSAWAEFNAANAGKANTPQAAPRPPGVSRSNTTRTPRKPGFDPMSGADEGQAGSTANYSSFRSRTRSDDARTFPPPPPRPQGFSREPEHEYRSSSRLSAEEVPYTEANRTKTPYSAHIGQQTYSSNDNLRRTQSTQNTANLGGDANPSNTGRHRSSSPPRPQQAQPKPRKPFVVYSSSEDSETDDSDEGGATKMPDATQPKSSGADASTENPFLRGFARPTKAPTPPSRYFTKTGSPLPTKSNASFGSTKANVGQDQEPSNGDVPQNGKPTMYGKTPFHFFFDHPTTPPSTSPDFTNSPTPLREPSKWSKQYPRGAERPVLEKSRFNPPPKFIPSSVNPTSKRATKHIPGWTEHSKPANTSAAAQPATEGGKCPSLVKNSKKHHTPEYESDRVLTPSTPFIDSDDTFNISPKGGVKLDSKFVVPLRLLFFLRLCFTKLRFADLFVDIVSLSPSPQTHLLPPQTRRAAVRKTSIHDSHQQNGLAHSPVTTSLLRHRRLRLVSRHHLSGRARGCCDLKPMQLMTLHLCPKMGLPGTRSRNGLRHLHLQQELLVVSQNQLLTHPPSNL